MLGGVLMSDVSGHDEWLTGQRRSQQQSERLLAQLWAQREGAAAPDAAALTTPVTPTPPSEPPAVPPPRPPGPGAHRAGMSARARAGLLAGGVIVAVAVLAMGLLWLRAEVVKAPLLCSPGQGAVAAGGPSGQGTSATVCLNH